jgi:glycosyltransferase involved in cell wall biosynthesis
MKIRRVAELASVIVLARLELYMHALRTRSQVCYCNDLDTLDVGIVMKLTGRRLIYDSHELYCEMIPVGFRRCLSALFEKTFVNIADVLITVNPFIASELRRRYRIRKRIHVVFNCPERHVAQAYTRRSHKPVVVLYHGGVDVDRGLENLVKASGDFNDRIRLVIRGNGKLKTRLRQLASGASNVRFEKSVPMNQIIQAATAADIGVIPYLATNLNQYYCSPNKLFEYIQAGLAVITSDLPFLKQIVMENKIGAVFDPEDPIDIARKINLVSREKNLEMFKRNVQHVRQRYSWEEEEKKLYVACADVGL